MIKKFENITIVKDRTLFDEIAEYEESLIQEATANGALSVQGADNEYTREIGRVGTMLADYESTYMEFKNLKFKSPLIIGIGNQTIIGERDIREDDKFCFS